MNSPRIAGLPRAGRGAVLEHVMHVFSGATPLTTLARGPISFRRDPIGSRLEAGDRALARWVVFQVRDTL